MAEKPYKVESVVEMNLAVMKNNWYLPIVDHNGRQGGILFFGTQISSFW